MGQGDRFRNFSVTTGIISILLALPAQSSAESIHDYNFSYKRHSKYKKHYKDPFDDDDGGGSKGSRQKHHFSYKNHSKHKYQDSLDDIREARRIRERIYSERIKLMKRLGVYQDKLESNNAPILKAIRGPHSDLARGKKLSKDFRKGLHFKQKQAVLNQNVEIQESSFSKAILNSEERLNHFRNSLDVLRDFMTYEKQLLTAGIEDPETLKIRDFKYQTGTKENVLNNAEEIKIALLNDTLNSEADAIESILESLEAGLKTKELGVTGSGFHFQSKSQFNLKEVAEFAAENQIAMTEEYKSQSQRIIEAQQKLLIKALSASEQNLKADADTPLTEDQLRSRLAELQKNSLKIQEAYDRYEQLASKAQQIVSLPEAIRSIAQTQIETQNRAPIQLAQKPLVSGQIPLESKRMANHESVEMLPQPVNKNKKEKIYNLFQKTAQPKPIGENEPILKISDTNEASDTSGLEIDKPEIFFQVNFRYQLLHAAGRFDSY